MGGIKLCRNRLGCFMKSRIYYDINYVENYYNLQPIIFEYDWPGFCLGEDPDDIIYKI